MLFVLVMSHMQAKHVILGELENNDKVAFQKFVLRIYWGRSFFLR